MEKIGNLLYGIYDRVLTDSVKENLIFIAVVFGFPLPFALLQLLLAYIFGTECFFVSYYPGILYVLGIIVSAVWCGIGSFRKPNWDTDWFCEGAWFGLVCGFLFELVLLMEAMVLETLTGVQIFN